MSEQNTDQSSTTTTETTPEAIADRIANVDIVKEQPAPSEAKPEKAATDGQPEAKVEKPATTEQEPKEEKKESETQPEAKAAEQTPEKDKPVPANPDQKVDDETAYRASLGLPPKEPETLETYKKKYSESSKEVHRIIDENKGKDTYLKQNGIEFVKKSDGTWTLKANEKYYEELKDVPDVFSQLSNDDKDLVDEEVAKKIVKATLAHIAVKKPRAEDVVEDVDVLNDGIINSTFQNLVQAKMPDGKTPVFTGIDQENMQGEIGKIFYDDAMKSLRQWASKSTDNFALAMNLIHAMVCRREAPRMAQAEEAKSKDQTKKDEVKNKTQLGQGSAQGQAKAKGSKIDIAERIARAGS